MKGKREISMLSYSHHFTVAGLIEELKKCLRDSPVGHYYTNSANRGDANWISLIRGVEICDDQKTVALIGGYKCACVVRQHCVNTLRQSTKAAGR
jgi:hypothetical protein